MVLQWRQKTYTKCANHEEKALLMSLIFLFVVNESAQPGTLIFDNNISETNGVALIDMLKVEYEKQYASNFRFVDFKVYPTLLSKEESETIRANCAEGTLTKETLISSAHSTEKRLLEKYSETLDGQDPYDVVCQMTTFDKLLKASRSYNIDTAPKLLNSREELVEVLIRSGVGRYLEFKSVDDLYIFDKAIKKLEKVNSLLLIKVILSSLGSRIERRCVHQQINKLDREAKADEIFDFCNGIQKWRYRSRR